MSHSPTQVLGVVVAISGSGKTTFLGKAHLKHHVDVDTFPEVRELYHLWSKGELKEPEKEFVKLIRALPVKKFVWMHANDNLASLLAAEVPVVYWRVPEPVMRMHWASRRLVLDGADGKNNEWWKKWTSERIDEMAAFDLIIESRKARFAVVSTPEMAVRAIEKAADNVCSIGLSGKNRPQPLPAVVPPPPIEPPKPPPAYCVSGEPWDGLKLCEKSSKMAERELAIVRRRGLQLEAKQPPARVAAVAPPQPVAVVQQQQPLVPGEPNFLVRFFQDPVPAPPPPPMPIPRCPELPGPLFDKHDMQVASVCGRAQESVWDTWDIVSDFRYNRGAVHQIADSICTAVIDNSFGKMSDVLLRQHIASVVHRVFNNAERREKKVFLGSSEAAAAAYGARALNYCYGNMELLRNMVVPGGAMAALHTVQDHWGSDAIDDTKKRRWLRDNCTVSKPFWQRMGVHLRNFGRRLMHPIVCQDYQLFLFNPPNMLESTRRMRNVIDPAEAERSGLLGMDEKTQQTARAYLFSTRHEPQLGFDRLRTAVLMHTMFSPHPSGFRRAPLNSTYLPSNTPGLANLCNQTNSLI